MPNFKNRNSTENLLLKLTGKPLTDEEVVSALKSPHASYLSKSLNALAAAVNRDILQNIEMTRALQEHAQLEQQRRTAFEEKLNSFEKKHPEQTIYYSFDVKEYLESETKLQTLSNKLEDCLNQYKDIQNRLALAEENQTLIYDEVSCFEASLQEVLPELDTQKIAELTQAYAKERDQKPSPFKAEAVYQSSLAKGGFSDARDTYDPNKTTAQQAQSQKNRAIAAKSVTTLQLELIMKLAELMVQQNNESQTEAMFKATKAVNNASKKLSAEDRVDMLMSWIDRGALDYAEEELENNISNQSTTAKIKVLQSKSAGLFGQVNEMRIEVDHITQMGNKVLNQSQFQNPFFLGQAPMPRPDRKNPELDDTAGASYRSPTPRLELKIPGRGNGSAPAA